MKRELTSLRLKLALWYTAVFGAILLVAGGSAYAFVARQIAGAQDRSLEEAVRAIIGAAQIHERERAVGSPAVADAFAELTIPGRALYVFDVVDGTLDLVQPSEAPPWIREAAKEALETGQVRLTHEIEATSPDAKDRSWRLYGRGFSLSGGSARYVGIAVADTIDLDEQYASLITAFSVGALLALLAAALGGYWLSGRAAAPAAVAFEQTRRFSADASHELRGAVAAIRTRAEAALSTGDPAARESALAAVAMDAAHLGDVLEKLLFMARAEYGRLTIQPEPVHLDDVMLACAPEVESLAARKDIEVVLEAHGDRPASGDPALLRRLLMILVDNAVKFTPSGGRIGIGTAVEGSRAILEVWDSGPGIPDGLRTRSFEPFYRADPTPDAEGGVGLGLAIAQRIVAAHRGTIEIGRSDAGGAAIRVALPLTSERDTAAL